MSRYPRFPKVPETDVEQVFSDVSKMIQASDKLSNRINAWNVYVNFTKSKMSSNSMAQMLSVLIPDNYRFSSTVDDPSGIAFYDDLGIYPEHQITIIRGHDTGKIYSGQPYTILIAEDQLLGYTPTKTPLTISLPTVEQGGEPSSPLYQPTSPSWIFHPSLGVIPAPIGTPAKLLDRYLSRNNREAPSLGIPIEELLAMLAPKKILQLLKD